MTAKEKSEISFEQALDQLEKLVSRMEEGDVALSELLEKYDEGNKHLRTCEARLKEAEMRIEKLRATPDGAELDEFEPEQP